MIMSRPPAPPVRLPRSPGRAGSLAARGEAAGPPPSWGEGGDARHPPAGARCELDAFGPELRGLGPHTAGELVVEAPVVTDGAPVRGDPGAAGAPVFFRGLGGDAHKD